MRRALAAGERARFTAHPNPAVGCVIARDGAVIAEGHTGRVGEAHAEIHALRAAGEAARGATAYVSLEPCSHHGRTPPCCEALIAAGVARVVVAIEDPNPLVAGRGLARLREAGIAVTPGIEAEVARHALRGFLSRMARGRPWVWAKVACSLDGRTALADGESQWITGLAARRDGQRWRAEAGCVLSGIGTVLDDDPQLNVRLSGEVLGIEGPVRQPLRALMDGEGRLPAGAAWLNGDAERIVYTRSDRRWSGATSVRLSGNGPLDPAQVLRDLAAREINSVHLEAGARLTGAFLSADLVDELVIYQAPVLLGPDARPLAQLPPLAGLDVARRWRIADSSTVGDDLRVVLLRA